MISESERVPLRISVHTDSVQVYRGAAVRCKIEITKLRPHAIWELYNHTSHGSPTLHLRLYWQILYSYNTNIIFSHINIQQNTPCHPPPKSQGFYSRPQNPTASTMSHTNVQRPLTTLQRNTKKMVTVRLKNEVEYRGKMDNVDNYMNLIMTNAEEMQGDKVVGKYGRVIVRGNNVLFIKLENEL